MLGRLGDPKGDVSGDAKWVDTAFEEIFANPGFERQARALARLVLVLPARDGVVAGAAELSSLPERANDTAPRGDGQATGTTDNVPDRRRVTSWRGPRSSKPV